MARLDKLDKETSEVKGVSNRHELAKTTSTIIGKLFTRDPLLQRNSEFDERMYEEYSKFPEEKKRRIEELAKKLDVYGIEYDMINKVLIFRNFKWTKELEEKLELLKGKPYAPRNVYKLYSLIKMKDIKLRIDRAEKLQQIGINLDYEGFSEDYLMSTKFDNLLNFLQSNDGQLLLNYFKGKSYAPKSVSDIYWMKNFNIINIKANIKLADKLEKYNVKVEFYDIVLGLKWTKELKEKMELLKGKTYAPKKVEDVLILQYKFSLWDIKNLIRTLEERKLEDKYVFRDLKQLALNN